VLNAALVYFPPAALRPLSSQRTIIMHPLCGKKAGCTEKWLRALL